MTEFLHNLVPWGTEVLISIQDSRTSLGDAFFKLITGLGDEQAYIVLFSLVYWCVSKPLGRGLTFCYLCSGWLNMQLKTMFAIPRPDGEQIVRLIEKPATPSFPSGHAQGVAVSWFYLAKKTGFTWLWAAAIILSILVGYSRMYLGVHFPQDIIAGWLIGLIFLAIWFGLENRVSRILERIPALCQGLLVVLVPVVLAVFNPTEHVTAIAGSIAGLGLGYLVERGTVNFDVSGSAPKRIMRGLIGLVLVMAVHLLLKNTLSGLEESGGNLAFTLLRTGRYAAVGFTTGYVSPLLFTLTGLANRSANKT